MDFTFKQYIRKIGDWWWLITADSPTNYSARYVNSDGALSRDHAYNGYNGVRPACVIHLKSREEKETKSHENGYKDARTEMVEEEQLKEK